MKRHYILHTGDRHNPEDQGALFGPFNEAELEERLNDVYADALAQIADIDAEELTDEEADEFYINSREFWMRQVDAMEGNYSDLEDRKEKHNDEHDRNRHP